MSRLSARDYKKTRHSGLDLARYREFGIGLGVGLCVALVVFVTMNGRVPPPAEVIEPRPEPRPDAVAPPADAGPAVEGGRQYDFYEMLPKFEVVVPEKDREVKRDVPAAPVERPGVYVLQAGSYRSLPDADRMAAQLVKQGIDARVQRVAVDSDVWHRVRIGPITDLGDLNRIRDRLRAAEVDALVIRVGD